jgi:hypothetical protein
LSAVGFDLFTLIAQRRKMRGTDIKVALEFNCTDRNTYDYLDTLVALGVLKREGILESSIYENTETSDYYLDKAKPSYVGGILEMYNERLYKMWGSLE